MFCAHLLFFQYLSDMENFLYTAVEDDTLTALFWNSSGYSRGCDNAWSI